MALSSLPPPFADREEPTSGRRERALRGREEIVRLTARLRSEHNEYESASLSWSPEAGEKKKELRKARADTLVEIAAALTWLGKVELFREIERLPFEQKLEQLEAFLDDPKGGSDAPSREGTTPPGAVPQAVAEPSIVGPDAKAIPQAILHDDGGPSVVGPEPGATPDAFHHAVAEPSVAGPDPEAYPDAIQLADAELSAVDPEPEATPDAIPQAVAEPSVVGPELAAPLEVPRVASYPTLLASMPPRSMRPRSRRPIGHWPMRLAPSAMPRAAPWRVPLLVGVIAVQGLALAVLALALSRTAPRHSESDSSRAATSSATATAMVTPLPPPATRPAGSGIPSRQPVAVPTEEPRPAADSQTATRAVPPPRPPPRSKPTVVPPPPALARRPEIFIPETL